MTFPIRRMRDRKLVGIKGRTYDNADPDKYLPYLTWNQSSFLFGEHMIRPAKEEARVVLVEGELDAIAVWVAGFTGLGLMGRYPSEEQKRKLRLIVRERPLVLLPDRDMTGHRWANSLGDKLVDEMSVLDAKVPKGKKDPDEMSSNEIRRAVEQARPRI